MISDPNGKTVLKIEFDNPEAAEHFAVWMTESGEQQYWDWMEVRETEEDGPITARFEYHVIKDASKASNDPERYGEFLGNNTIIAKCGRLDRDDEEFEEEDR